MGIKEYRREIDQIDKAILEKFHERMSVVEKIARYKRENNLPILNKEREEEVLDGIEVISGPELGQYSKELFRAIMEISKKYQQDRMELKALNAEEEK